MASSSNNSDNNLFRFAALIESASDAIFATTNQGIITDWNAAAERMYGYSAEEAIGNSIEIIAPADRHEEIGRNTAAVKNGNPVQNYETIRQRKDGIWFNVTLTIWPIVNESGEFLGFLAIHRDISESKRIAAALRESEASLANAQRIAQLGSWNIDFVAGTVQWSRQMCLIFGRDPETHEPTYETIIERVHAEDREAAARNHHAALDNAAPYDFIYRIVLPNGAVRTIHTRAEVTFDEAGKPAYLSGTAHDITERKQLEEQLRQSQKLEAVGQLTGGIAHEFNNLLAVALGNAEFLSEQLGDGKGGNMANSIIRVATRGAELTHRLLSFSRQQTLTPKAIDINSLVAGMIDMLSRTLGETIQIVAKDSSNLWLVKADPDQLESALLNISINAQDAMPNGGSLVFEATNTRLGDKGLAEEFGIVPGDYVELSVTDTGVGMHPKALEHVFEPFFTTKGVGEGSGLGLSMVHGFAAQSGGFVDIESHEGQGTTVRLYFPCVTNPAAISGADKENIAQVPSVGTTVLVVEDEPDVLEIVVAILSQFDCNVIEAEDGRTALSYLDEHRDIDVLFADVVLPGGVSGPDIAVEARRMIPGLKVVFTSGYPDGDINDLATDDGRPWFIRKPYRKSELAALFNEVLQS